MMQLAAAQIAALAVLAIGLLLAQWRNNPTLPVWSIAMAVPVTFGPELYSEVATGFPALTAQLQANPWLTVFRLLAALLVLGLLLWMNRGYREFRREVALLTTPRLQSPPPDAS